jgi:hypothetical protein
MGTDPLVGKHHMNGVAGAGVRAVEEHVHARYLAVNEPGLGQGRHGRVLVGASQHDVHASAPRSWCSACSTWGCLRNRSRCGTIREADACVPLLVGERSEIRVRA